MVKPLLHRPLALIVLDGFGYRTSEQANAIAQANTPFWDSLWQSYPHATLSASHQDVGLPDGQMGNSEVGHLTMGAGRVISQDLVRVSNEIQSGQFYKNPVLLTAFEHIKKNGSTLHVLGLLSPGGVHSHENHLFALLKFAKEVGLTKIIVHPFLDGRDTPPKSAEASLKILEALQDDHLKIGSISGRYYAMDRDKRYERTETVYALLTENKASFSANSALTALHNAYARSETDEFVKPTRIGNFPAIQEGDTVLFMNFRSDRARQLSYALTDPHFTGFKRKVFPKLATFISLSEYAKDISARILYPPVSLENMLGAVLEQHKLHQLRIAETEKYAHVTFFFNGGREIPFQNEDRILIPSPNVATYDHHPEMAAREITEKLVQAILNQSYDVIICNFANADMVGHTGQFEATVKAIEVLDECLKKIVTALKQVGGEVIITADHGNAEYMFDEKTRQPHTAHTDELVPFVFVGRPVAMSPFLKKNNLNEPAGTLADIAPTMLSLLGVEIPKEMTGNILVKPC